MRCPPECLRWQEGLQNQKQTRGIHNPDPGQEIKELIPRELWDYTDVFEERPLGQLPPSHPWDHVIDLKADFNPKKGRLIPLLQEELNKIDHFIEDNLAKEF